LAPVAGFTTISAMIAVFSSAQMIDMGMLGEYPGCIHASGMERPTYVIRDRAETADQPEARPVAAQRGR
jgi:hypothetical protein